jgi:hypothetical protein
MSQKAILQSNPSLIGARCHKLFVSSRGDGLIVNFLLRMCKDDIMCPFVLSLEMVYCMILIVMRSSTIQSLTPFPISHILLNDVLLMLCENFR